MTANRLLPLEPPFDADVAAVLDSYPQRDGYLLSLFRVFANSPRFLRKGTVNLLDRDSPLPMRERELVILRVCARRDCEYEWGVHVGAFAEHVGFTPEQVAATRLGPAGAACWTEREQTLLTVVDELCADGTLSDVSREQFQRAWPVDAQLEILALAGNYHTISFVANVAVLPPEPFAARFPRP
ncbi:MAG: carboxymuconolactone decarboxylase [Gammaproteobacteria bacterium]|nr:carboxymuconolactone decarboxylase [Gammaproteobacteria bacterium]|tara:strand:+ start:182 stop:733 length:552 start_codon:yes stop_codon:yes gene_type:complete